VDAKQFSELLTKPSHLQKHSVEELRQLAADYPFSQPVQLLYTIKLNNTSEYLFNRQLGRTSILTDDRSVLFDLFERPREVRPRVPEKATVSQQSATELEEPNTDEEKHVVEETPFKREETIEAMPETEEEKNKSDQLQKEEPAKPTAKEEAPIKLNPAEPGEAPSPKDRIQQILEENRRLRKQYEKGRGDAAPNEFEQRVAAIREKLQSLKPAEKEKSVSPSPTEPKPDIGASSQTTSSEAKVEPVISPEAASEAPAEGKELSQPKDEYSVEEEALVAAHNEKETEANFVDGISDEPVEETVREQHFEIDAAEKPEAPEEPQKEEGETPSEAPREDDEPAAVEKPASFFDWLHQLEERGTVIRKADENQETQESFEEKIQLLDSFVERLPQLKKKKPLIQKAGGSKVEVGKLRDTGEDESLVTETLAKVYLKQQHYSKAIKAYEILKLKYPEKSGLFADQISEIKKLVNSK